ncbi:MAG: type II toxin-antitoxin system RatA family toxin [Pseudomonadota bacterium]
MTTISQSAILPYSAEIMFNLVNDIESYPLFMHGCQGAQIISANANEVVARLELGKAGFKYAFSTRNQLRPPESIEMQLVEGPFKKFSAKWHFLPLTEAASKTSLEMQFEFRAGIIDMALRNLFEATSKDLVNAISKRAAHLYGRK